MGKAHLGMIVEFSRTCLRARLSGEALLIASRNASCPHFAKVSSHNPYGLALQEALNV
jgi:hypothetical protein